MSEKHKVVYSIQKGLYLCYHGYTPLCLLKDFEGDLEEMVYDIAWDSDTAQRQGSDYKKYQVVERDFWIFEDFQEFKRQWSNMRYFHKYVQFEFWKNIELTLKEKQKIFQLYLEDEKDCLFAINNIMQVKNMRSKFKLSLRNQFFTWLKEEAPQYPSPLSNRQVNAANNYTSHDLMCVHKARVSPLHLKFEKFHS